VGFLIRSVLKEGSVQFDLEYRTFSHFEVLSAGLRSHEILSILGSEPVPSIVEIKRSG
jgi:hypothetical protein